MKGYRIAMKLINQTKIFKFIVPIIVFILLYAVSTIRNNNVRKDGIYSIVTLVKYSSAYRGQSAKYEFVYMGHRTKRFFQWSGKMGERF